MTTRFKPGAQPQTHLFLAALLWTVVGFLLVGRGILWLAEADALWWLLPAGAAGLAKSFLVLDRVAKKNIARIHQFGKNYCLGGVYSLRTWMLVVGMMALGYILRRSGLEPFIIGFIYAIIGGALAYSARLFWLSWYGVRREGKKP